MPIITLTTDFSLRDHYVASMKGVILSINPKATIVDVTHDIEPQNVLQTAFIMRHIWPNFPVGTIHVAVVDPGVGTDRRIIAAEFNRQLLICPDNGIASLLHRDAPIASLREITNRQLFANPEPSATFHGRDIMAPVAAHLSRGTKLTELGPASDQMEILDLPKTKRNPDRSTEGEVIYIDAFGNLVTNLTREAMAPTYVANPEARVWLGERDVGPVRQTYADVNGKEPLALLGSVGMLEIAVNGGHAAKELDAGIGTAVRVK